MSCFSPDAGHVSEHADRPGDAAAGVEHEVLAVVSPQQLHVLGHADGADLTTVRTLGLSTKLCKDFTVPAEGPSEMITCDNPHQVDGEEQDEGGDHGPDRDDQHGQRLHPQQVRVPRPEQPVIAGSSE